jgi:hypothetical protein
MLMPEANRSLARRQAFGAGSLVLCYQHVCEPLQKKLYNLVSTPLPFSLPRIYLLPFFAIRPCINQAVKRRP